MADTTVKSEILNIDFQVNRRNLIFNPSYWIRHLELCKNNKKFRGTKLEKFNIFIHHIESVRLKYATKYQFGTI